MKKLGYVSISATLVAGAFLAGLAVGGPPKVATYKPFSEATFEEVSPGGPKMATLTGNWKKGTYVGLLQIPGGFNSGMHSHGGAYEAIQIMGTSTHWGVGEDGTQAKKMVPGSYWSMPGKLPHVSQCEKGADCVVLIMQKAKFDFKPLGTDGKALPKAPPTETKATTTPAPAPAKTTTPAPAPAKTTTPAPAPAKTPAPTKTP